MRSAAAAALSCSQTRSTCQPARASSRSLRRSRSTLISSFSRHQSALARGWCDGPGSYARSSVGVHGDAGASEDDVGAAWQAGHRCVIDAVRAGTVRRCPRSATRSGRASGPAAPPRTAPQDASLVVADGGGLDRVLRALAGDEGGPSGASGLRPTHLGFGAVDAQCDVAGREPAFGQQRPDRADCPGRWGGPRPDRSRRDLVGQIGAQVDQGDQQPVGEHQLVL